MERLCNHDALCIDRHRPDRDETIAMDIEPR
jgi:hypothetical protein